MSINYGELIRLRRLTTLSFRRKHIIILNPDEKQQERSYLIEDMEYDKAGWKIQNEEIQTFIEELRNNNQLSNEEKILLMYEELCKKYIYDDNLISYLRPIEGESRSFELPDGYGREVNEEWEQKREQHNRRVCYEVSRYLAKALKDIFKNEEDFNICIFWDKPLTHYFVGLSCKEYSLTLDLDDFNNIKDLTRIKTGLTAQGIRILKDDNKIFENALSDFNSDREEDSIEKIKKGITSSNGDTEELKNEVIFDKTKETILFLQNAIEILKKDNIDSQGLFEYMKEIVDIMLGPEDRKKVWKVIKGNNYQSTRCVRCLVIKIDNKKYIVDVEERLLREFDDEELGKGEFMSYAEGSQRRWGTEPYDGA